MKNREAGRYAIDGWCARSRPGRFNLWFLAIVSLIGLKSGAAVAQGTMDSTRPADSVLTGLALEGVQLDAGFLVFSYWYSAALDVNVAEIIRPNDRFAVGGRVGFDHFASSSLEHESYGSPWTDINLLGRISLQIPDGRFNLYAGATHRRSEDVSYHNSHYYFKFGGDLEWLFISNVAGVCLNFRLTPADDLAEFSGGLGVVVYLQL